MMAILRYILTGVTGLLVLAALARADENGTLVTVPLDDGGNGDACQVGYERIGWKWKVGPLHHRWTQADYERMSQAKLGDMFQKAKNAAGDPVLDITRVSINKFRAHFDDYLAAQELTGKIPAYKLAKFRTWLKDRYNEPYPKLSDFKPQLTAVYDRGGTVKNFEDAVFLEFVAQSEGASPASVETYVKSLDHSQLAAYKEMAKTTKSVVSKNAREALKYSMGGGIVITAVNKSVEPIMNAVNTGVAKFRGWAADLLARETTKATLKINQTDDHYNFAYHQAADLTAAWANEKYTDRGQAARSFVATSSQIRANMSHLRALLPQFDADFDSRLEKQLRDATASVDAKLQRYDDLERHLVVAQQNQLKATTVASKITADDAKNTQQDMDQLEKELASIYSDWVLYQSLHGYQDPIPEDLNEAYDYNLYKFLQRMNPDALRAKSVLKIQEELDKAKKSGLVS